MHQIKKAQLEKNKKYRLSHWRLFFYRGFIRYISCRNSQNPNSNSKFAVLKIDCKNFGVNLAGVTLKKYAFRLFMVTVYTLEIDMALL